MKILLTTPSMQAGGAERVVTMLAEGLAERGHELALAAPPGVRDEDLREVPHLRLPLNDHGRAAGGILRSAAHLAGAIRRFSPDLVHAQNVKSAAVARLAAYGGRPGRQPPLLATFHGVLPQEYRRSALLLRAADEVACVSTDLRDEIVAAGLPAARVSLVRNAVDSPPPLAAAARAALDEELGIAGAPVVAVVGRLVPQKAHHRFVIAARRVADELPEARFLIVGEGPLRGEIEAEVRDAGLAPQVRVTGMRTDAREIIARADLVVFSSDWEGLSIVALEALAAGTPVVATEVQGMREVLDRGAGAVVPFDDGTALGRRVAELLEDEQARRAMGAAGQELIASEFSLDTMVDAYEVLYERLARAARTSAAQRA